MEVRLRNGSKEYTLQREGSQKISRNGSKDYPVPLQRENSHRNISMLTDRRPSIDASKSRNSSHDFSAPPMLSAIKQASFKGTDSESADQRRKSLSRQTSFKASFEVDMNDKPQRRMSDTSRNGSKDYSTPREGMISRQQSMKATQVLPFQEPSQDKQQRLISQRKACMKSYPGRSINSIKQYPFKRGIVGLPKRELVH